MTIQPIHILNQLGVMTSFSVAKKITENTITKFFLKQKRAGKKDNEIETMLKEKISSEIQTAIQQNKVPGLLSPQEIAEELGMDKNIIKNAPELNMAIMVIAQKLSEKKYDKMSLCYFINTLVNILNLDEADFTNFHEQIEDPPDDEDGFDDDDLGTT